jgi:hypothetical protein
MMITSAQNSDILIKKLKMNNIQSPRGLEYLHADIDSIDKNMSSPRETEEIERNSGSRFSAKSEKHELSKISKIRETNPEKQPLYENLDLFNQKNQVPHTDESFGESNLYNPFKTQFINLERDHSVSPTLEDETQLSRVEEKDASPSSKNSREKVKNLEGLKHSPGHLKENTNQLNIKRSLSVDKKKSIHVEAKNKEKGQNSSAILRDQFENIMNGILLLKNSVDHPTDAKVINKDKNYKKYNHFFKKQKELVEQSER